MRLESELLPQLSKDQYSVGGYPKEVRWTVTPSKRKDSDRSDSRKTFIILMVFYLFSRFFWIFFLPPPHTVIVNFIGTIKSSQVFELFFFSATYFIVITILCLYVGLLQFCGFFFLYF